MFKELENGVFYCFYLMSEQFVSRPTTTRWLLSALVIGLDFGQAFSFFLRTNPTRWSDGLIDVAFAFDVDDIVTSLLPEPIAFALPFLAVCFVVLEFTAAFIVIRAFTLQKFNESVVWVAKMLRILVTFIVDTLYINVLAALLIPVTSCAFYHRVGLSLTTSKDPVCDLMSHPAAIGAVIIALIAAVGHIIFALSSSFLFFDPNPLALEPRSQHTGRVEIAFNVVKTSIVLTSQIHDELYLFNALINFALIVIAFVLHIRYLPFRKPVFNYSRGGLLSVLMWVALCNCFSLGIEDADSLMSLQWAMIGLCIAFFIIGVGACRLRYNRLRRLIANTDYLQTFVSQCETEMEKQENKAKALGDNSSSTENDSDLGEGSSVGRMSDADNDQDQRSAKKLDRLLRMIGASLNIRKEFFKASDSVRPFHSEVDAEVLFLHLASKRSLSLCDGMETVLLAALYQFEGSKHLSLLYAIMLMWISEDMQQASALFTALHEQKDLSIDDRYILFVIEKKVVQNAQSTALGGGKELSAIGLIEFNQSLQLAQQEHFDSMKQLSNLWASMDDQVPAHKLVDALGTMVASVKTARSHYKKLLEKFPKSAELADSHGRFLMDVFRERMPKDRSKRNRKSRNWNPKRRSVGGIAGLASPGNGFSLMTPRASHGGGNPFNRDLDVPQSGSASPGPRAAANATKTLGDDDDDISDGYASSCGGLSDGSASTANSNQLPHTAASSRAMDAYLARNGRALSRFAKGSTAIATIIGVLSIVCIVMIQQLFKSEASTTMSRMMKSSKARPYLVDAVFHSRLMIVYARQRDEHLWSDNGEELAEHMVKLHDVIVENFIHQTNELDEVLAVSMPVIVPVGLNGTREDTMPCSEVILGVARHAEATAVPEACPIETWDQVPFPIYNDNNPVPNAVGETAPWRTGTFDLSVGSGKCAQDLKFVLGNVLTAMHCVDKAMAVQVARIDTFQTNVMHMIFAFVSVFSLLFSGVVTGIILFFKRYIHVKRCAILVAAVGSWCSRADQRKLRKHYASRQRAMEAILSEDDQNLDDFDLEGAESSNAGLKLIPALSPVRHHGTKRSSSPSQTPTASLAHEALSRDDRDVESSIVNELDRIADELDGDSDQNAREFSATVLPSQIPELDEPGYSSLKYGGTGRRSRRDSTSNTTSNEDLETFGSTHQFDTIQSDNEQSSAGSDETTEKADFKSKLEPETSPKALKPQPSPSGSTLSASGTTGTTPRNNTGKPPRKSLSFSVSHMEIPDQMHNLSLTNLAMKSGGSAGTASKASPFSKTEGETVVEDLEAGRRKVSLTTLDSLIISPDEDSAVPRVRAYLQRHSPPSLNAITYAVMVTLLIILVLGGLCYPMLQFGTFEMLAELGDLAVQRIASGGVITVASIEMLYGEFHDVFMSRAGASEMITSGLADLREIHNRFLDRGAMSTPSLRDILLNRQCLLHEGCAEDDEGTALETAYADFLDGVTRYQVKFTDYLPSENFTSSNLHLDNDVDMTAIITSLEEGSSNRDGSEKLLERLQEEELEVEQILTVELNYFLACQLALVLFFTILIHRTRHRLTEELAISKTFIQTIPLDLLDFEARSAFTSLLNADADVDPILDYD